jgi:hemoglobin
MSQMSTPHIHRDYPAGTADLTRQTGLNDAMLNRPVHRFYGRERDDPLLGPVFAERIADWGPHLATMVDFWSSVALMTGRYHGSPMSKHLPLPVEAQHFAHWLDLFRQTATEAGPPDGAAWVIERAEGIAGSIRVNISDARGGHGRFGTQPRL